MWKTGNKGNWRQQEMAPLLLPTLETQESRALCARMFILGLPLAGGSGRNRPLPGASLAISTMMLDERRP